jgi:hypothetical protein
VGNVDSGKSTTLGVLTRGLCRISVMPLILLTPRIPIGALDDGRGRARVALFRHKHEIETGRTSSVGMEVGTLPFFYPRFFSNIRQILGFAPSGAPILPNSSTSSDSEATRHDKLSWDAIAEQAAKIVSFIGASHVFLVPNLCIEHLA